MDSNHSIAAIGQNNSPEMRPVTEFLSEVQELGQVIFTPDIPLLIHALNEQQINFDIVIVLQNHPLEYSYEAIQQLINSAPLSQILCCYSSWSESDGRNNSGYWPVSFCVPARAAIPRIQHAISILEGTKQNLPLSAGKDEVFLNTIPEKLCRELGFTQWTVFIESPDLEFRQMLKDLIGQISSQLAVINSKQEAQICLWDMDPFNETRKSELKEFRIQSPCSIIIPLMNFPQPEENLLLQDQFKTTEVIPKLHLTGFLPDIFERTLLIPETL